MISTRLKSAGRLPDVSADVQGQQTPVKMDMGDCADSATPLHAARQDVSSPGIPYLIHARL